MTDHQQEPVTLAWLAARAAEDVDLIVDEHVRRIREHEPDYALVPAEELRSDARELVAQALECLATGHPLWLGGAQRTARRRAEQRVPLGPLLHAFRLGFTALWQRLLMLAEAEGPAAQLNLLLGVEAVWAVVDAYSGDVTAAYQEGLVALANLDAQRRLDALGALLEGRRADWALMSADAAVIGLPTSADYVAIVVELAPGHSPARTPEELLRGAGFPCTLRSAAGQWEGLVALPGRRTLADLVEQLAALWTGRTGVSEPYADLLQTSDAFREAAAALRCLPGSVTGVARLSDDRLASLLTQQPELSAATSGAFLGRLDEAEDRDQLLATLSAYFDCGSVSATAARLFCHRNTVGRQLRRVEELTGRRLDDPRGTAELYFAVRTRQLLKVQAHR